MDPFWSVVIGLLSGAAGVGSVWAVVYRAKGQNRNEAATTKAALDARIDARVKEQLESAWDRIDTMEKTVEALEKKDSRRSGAITRILRDLARQWPSDKPPQLNPSDIAEIEETVPSSWIKPGPRPV